MLEHIRPSWDLYFMFIAQMVSTRATCSRAHVGCVIVDSGTHYVLATGYNGVEAGAAHCPGVHLQHMCMRDGHCARSLHAEHNALNCAKATGVDVRNATMYVTHMPCVDCAGMIIKAGVKRVVYAAHYRPNPLALQYLSEADVTIERHASLPQPCIRALHKMLQVLTAVEKLAKHIRGILQ